MPRDPSRSNLKDLTNSLEKRVTSTKKVTRSIFKFNSTRRKKSRLGNSAFDRSLLLVVVIEV